MSDERYIVGPVLKALRILETIAGKGHPVTLTAIATELQLPKTSTFRYLRTLSAAGFLTYEEGTDRYSVGQRFRLLARVDSSIQRLREVALPALKSLNQEFNETINLGVMVDGEIVYIDMVESTRALRMQARIGGRDPLHSTALGKAILSRLPDGERALLLSDALAQRTLRTVTQIKTIERQLRDVARDGVAIEIGENEEGTMCIGVPIVDARAYPVAALSLSAPERRVTGPVRDRAVARLKVEAAEISRALFG